VARVVRQLYDRGYVHSSWVGPGTSIRAVETRVGLPPMWPWGYVPGAIGTHLGAACIRLGVQYGGRYVHRGRVHAMCVGVQYFKRYAEAAFFLYCPNQLLLSK
jgi:hypothetical protein